MPPVYDGKLRLSLRARATAAGELFFFKFADKASVSS